MKKKIQKQKQKQMKIKKITLLSNKKMSLMGFEPES